jgi:acyl-CoA synthetase (AMP-forming)/AMP-acid ligase II
VACVAPVEEHRGRITKEEILEFLRPRVAKWQLPDDVVFIEAVPKTSVGKFNKRALREQLRDCAGAGSKGKRPVQLSPANGTLVRRPDSLARALMYNH